MIHTGHLQPGSGGGAHLASDKDDVGRDHRDKSAEGRRVVHRLGEAGKEAGRNHAHGVWPVLLHDDVEQRHRQALLNDVPFRTRTARAHVPHRQQGQLHDLPRLGQPHGETEAEDLVRAQQRRALRARRLGPGHVDAPPRGRGRAAVVRGRGRRRLAVHVVSQRWQGLIVVDDEEAHRRHQELKQLEQGRLDGLTAGQVPFRLIFQPSMPITTLCMPPSPCGRS